jgi:ABC-2 type transport system ATP-binding protein
VSSPAAPPAIEASGLVRHFGRGRRKVVALAGIDLRLERGGALALLGANGSGKSTTMKIALGLLEPTEGSVRVLGGAPGRREARAATGYVPEEARRLPTATGREIVDLFARLQGVRPRHERRRRVEEALALCGLPPSAARRRAAGYSRGMARRLALAAAWVHAPPLLVLDEPTSGLDPLGTEEILVLLRRHHERGGTLLLSTHDRVTAEGACDTAVVLSEGRVAAQGPLSELLAGDPSPSLAPLLRRVGTPA